MKNIIITGATSGIGRATSEVFAKEGNQLILTGRRRDRLEKIKRQLESKYSCNIWISEFDVRNYKECQSFVANIAEEFPTIDLLINNAGLASGFSSVDEGDIEDWEKMIDTNVKGLAYMVRLISPIMKTHRSGHIINICSTAGHEVYPNGNMYCASKHAVDALTKGSRLDLYKFGIRVSQVSPGHVENTEFAYVRFHGDQLKSKIYEDFNPLKSEDVANTIHFIASQPAHVNIQDVLMMSTQQASSNFIDRSGRKYD